MSEELINKVHELLEADDMGRCELTEWERDFLNLKAEQIELGKDKFYSGEVLKIREIYEGRLQ